jgi:hypothetical protein
LAVIDAALLDAEQVHFHPLIHSKSTSVRAVSFLPLCVTAAMSR